MFVFVKWFQGWLLCCHLLFLLPLRRFERVVDGLPWCLVIATTFVVVLIVKTLGSIVFFAGFCFRMFTKPPGS